MASRNSRRGRSPREQSSPSRQHVRRSRLMGGAAGMVVPRQLGLIATEGIEAYPDSQHSDDGEDSWRAACQSSCRAP